MFNILLKIYSLLDENQKKKLFFLQLLIVITSLLEVGALFLAGQFMFLVTDIENFNRNENFYYLYSFFAFSNEQKFILTFSFLVMVFFIITAIISIFTIWKLSMYGVAVGIEISNKLFNYFVNQEWLFYTKNNSSTLINKISIETGRVSASIIMPLMHMNARIVLCIFIIISIFIYDFFSSLVGLSVFLFSYLILYKNVQSKLYKLGISISNTQSARIKIMNETFGSIKEILLYGRADFFREDYQNQSKKYADAYGMTQALSSMPKYMIELIAILFLSTLLLAMAFNNNVDLKNILPFLAIFGFAIFKLLPALQQIYLGISSIKSNLSAFENIQNEIEIIKKEKYGTLDKEKLYITKRDKLILRKEIILKNISYQYVENRNVLSNINMRINKNTIVGLAGPSGCGKSTLADIIMGLIEPLEGNIFLDGKEISKEKKIKRRWQNSIGYVSQSIYLTDASISENIFFGLDKKNIVPEKMNKCIKMSNLEDLVKELHSGVETIVGEKGIKLSGGQRQRIGIARALYHEMDFLVFDEATSSLDGISEKKIMNSIENLSGKKTILLITHRLSTLRNCDIIYFMNQGKIVDSGNYSYLISKNKLFQKMSENYN
jgi:ABC-type multidrug transport system fused ATPase/permease subunit